MSNSGSSSEEQQYIVINKRKTMLHIICESAAVETLPQEIVEYVEEEELTLDGQVIASGQTAAEEGFVALLVTGKVPNAFIEWLSEHDDISDFSRYVWELPTEETEEAE